MCSFVIIVDYISAYICIRIVVSRLYNTETVFSERRTISLSNSGTTPSGLDLRLCKPNCLFSRLKKTKQIPHKKKSFFLVFFYRVTSIDQTEFSFSQNHLSFLFYFILEYHLMTLTVNHTLAGFFVGADLGDHTSVVKLCTQQPITA